MKNTDQICKNYPVNTIDDNKIYCKDCVNGMKLIGDDTVDMVITSPPYDDLREYNGYSWDLESVVPELFRILKPGGVVVWIVGDSMKNHSETCTSFKHALCFRENGFLLHDTMIWEKICPFQHKNRYIQAFEYMFVFSKGQPKTFNLIRDRKNRYSGTKIHGTERQPDGKTKPLSQVQKSKEVKEYGARFNIWEIPPVKHNKYGHPAPFPERLAHDHIITWSNVGDLVLDPFIGSGTTAVACINSGRRYIGFDVSSDYCAIAEQRIVDVIKEKS